MPMHTHLNGHGLSADGDATSVAVIFERQWVLDAANEIVSGCEIGSDLEECVTAMTRVVDEKNKRAKDPRQFSARLFW